MSLLIAYIRYASNPTLSEESNRAERNKMSFKSRVVKDNEELIDAVTKSADKLKKEYKYTAKTKRKLTWDVMKKLKKSQ